MNCRLDHLTITAPSLQAGRDWLAGCLGVDPQAGGEHPRMGTHNLLLRLGDSMYLEIIAVNPVAPSPGRPRWFELDRLRADAKPRLAGWVARTPDIGASLALAPDDFGVAVPMARAHLKWLISIPEDGSLPLGGAASTLIQWQTPGHPANSLQDQGCQLMALELRHPEPGRVRELIRRLGVVEPDVQVTVVAGSSPGLAAHIRTPAGLRTLGLD